MDTRLEQLKVQVEIVKTRVAGMQAHDIHEHMTRSYKYYTEDDYQAETQELANILERMRDL